MKTVTLLCLAMLAQASWAYGDILWLSETAPGKARPERGAEPSAHAGHEHHQMAGAGGAASAPVAASAVAASGNARHKHDANEINPEGDSPGKDHKPGKKLWLRQGDDIRNAKYAATQNASERITVVDLAGNKTEADTSPENNRMTLALELPEIGFYQAYLEQRAVRDGRLVVQLPKAELLWASCSAKAVDEEAVAKPIVNPASPLELVREHGADEGCMARLVSGDAVNFRVLSFGQPVAGVPVTMITLEGWRNTRTSDADGRVSFTLIREYYPKWLEFRKYHTDTFLTVAELDKPEAGELGGLRYASAHYVATLPGKYRPSPYDYRSYAWGLGISSFIIIAGGLSVYLYRRRRLKPYQEERIDEQA